MLVLLDIVGNCTTHLLEDLLKPSDRVGRSSLVIFMPTEADWNTGPKITIAALLRKKNPHLEKKDLLQCEIWARRRQFS